MSFITKINLQDNRQHYLPYRESHSLSGLTTFGQPFNSIPTGPDSSNSGTSGTIINIVSTFSGNTGTTIFNFGHPNMGIAQNQFQPITTLNSGLTQSSGYVWVGTNSQIVDGNLSYLNYTGTSFDITVSSITETSPGLYSGSVYSTDVFWLSADTLDFTGRTIWSDVVGIHRTEKIIISDNPINGAVLTSDSNGLGSWQPLPTTTGMTSQWVVGSGGSASSIKNISTTNILNVDCIHSVIIGGVNNTLNQVTDSLVVGGNNNVVDGTKYSTILGGTSNLIDNTYRGSMLGCESASILNTDSGVIIGGRNGLIGGSPTPSDDATRGVLVGGIDNRILNGVNSVVIGGNNISSTVDNMVYVPDLIIDGLNSVDPLATDANGKIVAGASDIRLKENINDLENPLEIIRGLRGVSYEWTKKSNMGSGLRYGLIAQEVKEVIPDMVRIRAKGDGMLTLNYTEIVPWLIESIKMLSNPNYTKFELHTQTIVAEDNFIELNYGGNHLSSVGGGIILKDGIEDGFDSFITSSSKGKWVIGPSLFVKQLTLGQYTPLNSGDIEGDIGDITWSDDFIYIKTNNGWRRTNLNTF